MIGSERDVDSRLADHMRHVGVVDEEDFVVSIDKYDDNVNINSIWRSEMVGERSICHWGRLSLDTTKESNLGKGKLHDNYT